MAKRPEDEKGRKVTKKQSSQSPQSVTNRSKKNSQAKLSSDIGIAKSKQLLSKSKTTRSSCNITRSATTKSMSTRSSKSNGALRLCGNGIPMPSLAELERMYDDDSDDDSNNNLAPTTYQNDPGRCKTPVQQPVLISEDKLTSPTTLKVIASKMIDLISNLPVNEIDSPPPPVIPPKKRKKSDKPYIVGCKDRKRVPWAPKTSFCKGDDKYGVEEHNESDDEENSCPKKRRRYGKVNVSKSIFNAKSDKISSWLNQSEQFDEQVVKSQTSDEQRKQCDKQVVKLQSSAGQRKRQASSDSDKTVDYNFGAGSPLNLNRFSPIPSTSRDNDTFLINDQRFNESLHSSHTNKTTTDSDDEIEIVNETIETVVIDDSVPVRKMESMNYTDDDCCVIVEPQSEIISINSPNMDSNIIDVDSPHDNGYGSLDFNLNLENDDCEIIDVDDVLAESQAIISKYQKQDGLDLVTVVDPSRSYAPISANKSTTALAPIPSNHRGNNSVSIEEPASNTSVIAIEDVVTNFFVNSNYCPSNSRTVDLTELSEIPRDWTTFISSLPRSNILNSNDQNVQIVAPTVSHISDSPANMSRPAAGHALVDVNAPAHNATIIHVPSNTNNWNVVASHPVEPPPNNLSSRRLGDCPICMESLGSSPIGSTICGHIFCMDCIKAAIRTNGKRCPTCRKLLKGKDGYHQLFL